MADRDQPSRQSWPPLPGYFRLRLVKDGWRAPAQIIFADGLWQAIIDGEEGEPDADPVVAGVDTIWAYGAFSTADEYAFLNATREWARQYRSDHPAADARRPRSKRRMKPIIV